MKKITSILALFLMCFGISLQAAPTDLPELTTDQKNPKYYVIKNVRRGTFVSYAGEAVKMNQVASAESLNEKFYFMGSIENNVAKVKIYNGAAEGLACSTINSWTAEGAEWYISAKTNTGLSISSTADFSGNNSWNDYQGTGKEIDVWSATDPGSIFEIYDPTAEPVEVTYNYFIDGKKVATQTATQRTGESYYAPALHVSLTYSYENNDKITAQNNVVKVNCSEELPFVKSASFEEAKWYFMTIHGSKFYLNYVEGATSMELTRTTTPQFPEEMSAADMWCFVGNVVDGFEIYNKAAGNTKVLSSSYDMGTDNGGSTYPILTEKSSINVNNANLTWDFSYSNQLANLPGLFLNQHGKAGNKLNKRGDKLAYWSQGADGGSTVLLTAVPTEAEIIDGYKREQAPVVGYVGGLSKDAFDKLTNVKTVAELTEFIAANKNNSSAMPVDGQLYRIKNFCRDLSASNNPVANNGGYMGDNQMKGDSVSCHTKSLADATCIWVLEKSGENFLVKNLNSGKYLGKTAANASQYLAQVSDVEQAGVYEVVALGNAQFRIVCTNGEGSHKDLHASSPKKEGPGVMNWNAAENSASAWHFVPATSLEVNMNKVSETATESWASLYLPFGVQLATGLEAYAGKINRNTMNLTKVDAVPANYGVILKGTEAKYTLTIAEVAKATVANDLKGTNVEIAKVENSVVLGNNNGIGLFAPAAEVLKANKAYAVVAPAAAVSGLKFVFGETTGVEGVEVETENAVYYDLSGRRVANPTKGIYVVNGKKVYVK